MAGSFSGGYEGFIVKMKDNGNSSEVVQGQWIGGSSWDSINTLAVSGDVIYAGGRSGSDVNWERCVFLGSVRGHGDGEGIVAKVIDRTPTPVKFRIRGRVRLRGKIKFK